MRHKKTAQEVNVDNRHLAATTISILVAAYGVYIIGDTLLNQIFSHHIGRLSDALVDLPLLIGLSVIYLSTLLSRRKWAAWLITILAYVFYLGVGISQLLSHIDRGRMFWPEVIRSIILPLLLLLLLYLFRGEFVVRSDIRGFRSSLRFIVVILVVTIVYGVAGFQLMDTSDFHQEISWGAALHYTIDQFNLTTSKPVKPYTRRAKLFDDSLSFVSLVSLIYVAISLFQPLRSRFSDQTAGRERTVHLLNKYGASSEEFFKLWPHDKQYFFDNSGESVLAFHVYNGVALCLSDPVGNPDSFNDLIVGFNELCFYNDWLPAMVHVSSTYRGLYEDNGFTMQKLGQEALVDLNHFNNDLKKEKYFRQIINKFDKQNYSYELLSPPHHKAVLDRLKTISDDWLSKGNRSERGYSMGYYTDHYMQLCQVAVARDAAGTIQAFMNLVPAEFDMEEATYDLLRNSSKGLSNIGDYLLINVCEQLAMSGYKRLNMGLSPLAGLDNGDKDRKTILDNVLKFAYANGDIFFSFSGLHKFKSKYEPDWQDRYIAFKGGVRGFSRTITALTRCMSKTVKLRS